MIKILLKRKVAHLASLIFSIPAALFSLSPGPWLSESFELRPSIEVAGQTYHTLDSGRGNIHYVSRDIKVTGGLETSALDILGIGISFTGVRSHAHTFVLDSSSYAARWLLMDDVVGDPVSLAVDFQYNRVTGQGLDDPSYVHHGVNEYVLTSSVGKEWSCGAFWTSRIYGNCSFGIASQGSPWTKLTLGGDYLLTPFQWIGVDLKDEIGFGKRQLKAPPKFNGYGGLQYRSVETAFRYHISFAELGEFKVGLSKRIYARNAPVKVQEVLFQWVYPFGL